MIPRLTWTLRTKQETKVKAPAPVADLLTTNQVSCLPIYSVTIPSVSQDLKHLTLIYDQLSRCPSKPTETNV